MILHIFNAVDRFTRYSYFYNSNHDGSLKFSNNLNHLELHSMQLRYYIGRHLETLVSNMVNLVTLKQCNNAILCDAVIAMIHQANSQM